MTIQKNVSYTITMNADVMRELISACDYAQRHLNETLGPLTETGSAGKIAKQVSSWRSLHAVLQNARASQ